MRNGSRNKSELIKADPKQVVRFEKGSENVFADLGLPNPEIALAKAELVQRIRQLISDRKLTQSTAAKLLGIDQPKVSALVRGRVEGFSIDRLLRFLNALGETVEIIVPPNRDVSKSRSVLVT